MSRSCDVTFGDDEPFAADFVSCSACCFSSACSRVSFSSSRLRCSSVRCQLLLTPEQLVLTARELLQFVGQRVGRSRAAFGCRAS